MNKDRILLESGTNELEILEFIVGTNKFSINVVKVKEIINPLPITPLPQSHPHVEGVIELREEVLPVVDMAKVLDLPSSAEPEKDKLIVVEFNQQKIVFHVHDVTHIHRVSWNQIEKPSDMYHRNDGRILGIVRLSGEILLFLDFEKIMADINPASGIQASDLRAFGERVQSNKRIIVAEDSALLRKLIEETLNNAGYHRTLFFENGQEAYAFLEHLAQSEDDIQDVHLLVTDVEMPQMDGHHLTKRIKDHPVLSHLPVIIFSSLITNDLRHKGEMVGADAQVSKPDIADLIRIIDEHIL